MNIDTGHVYENEQQARDAAGVNEHILRVPRQHSRAALAALVAGASAYDPAAPAAVKPLSEWGRRKRAQAKKREKQARKAGRRAARGRR